MLDIFATTNKDKLMCNLFFRFVSKVLFPHIPLTPQPPLAWLPFPTALAKVIKDLHVFLNPVDVFFPNLICLLSGISYLRPFSLLESLSPVVFMTPHSSTSSTAVFLLQTVGVPKYRLEELKGLKKAGILMVMVYYSEMNKLKSAKVKGAWRKVHKKTSTNSRCLLPMKLHALILPAMICDVL